VQRIDHLVKLRDALATTAPATKPVLDPDAYPGLKITQQPAEATELDDVVDAAFEAFAWPDSDAAIPRSDDLTADQRALANLIASVPGVPLYRWAIPQAAWARRRWLGIDPAGAVERHDLARRLHAAAAQDDGGAAAILKTLPIAERIEAFGDLMLGAYRVEPPALDLEDGEIGAVGKTWAPAFADRLLALFAPGSPHVERNGRKAPEPALCALVCDALVASGVPIEERWDAFVPNDAKVLATLPPARQGQVIVRGLEDEFTNHGLREGLELVVQFPSQVLVDYLIGLADQCTESLLCPPRRGYLAQLRDALGAHPELAARVSARIASLPPLPVLRCTSKLYPKHVDQMSPGQRAMFSVLGQGWETDDGSMVTEDDDGETQFAEEILYVSAYEIAGEDGSAYHALLYMDEDGSVCRANTTNQVMMSCQMRLSWNIDDTLAEALHAILRERPGGRSSAEDDESDDDDDESDDD
jgi:hypothetical protein